MGGHPCKVHCPKTDSGGDVLVAGAAVAVLVGVLGAVLVAVAGVIEAIAVAILVLCIPAAALTMFFCARNAPPPWRAHPSRVPVRVRSRVRALPAPPRELEAPVTVTVLSAEEVARGLQRQQPVQR